jgi:hypothetical protein
MPSWSKRGIVDEHKAWARYCEKLESMKVVMMFTLPHCSKTEFVRRGVGRDDMIMFTITTHLGEP